MRKLICLLALAVAVALGGCGNKVTISEASGVPLCSDVLSGAATLPADNKCLDDD